MWHFCPAKEPQHPAPLNRTFPPGIVAEASLTGGLGGKGGGSNCDQCIRDTPHPCILLQEPWESNVGIVRKLDKGSTQPQEAEVGADNKGIGVIVIICPDFGNVLRGSCSGSFFI